MMLTVQKGGCGCRGGGMQVTMLPGDQHGPVPASVLLSGFLSLASPVFLEAGSNHTLP